MGNLNLALLCYSDERKDPGDAIFIKNTLEVFCGPMNNAVKFIRF